MMRALCLFDTERIRAAVRRYVHGLHHGELERLLRESLDGLDEYHRTLLKVVLDTGTGRLATGDEKPQLQQLFASFVSENPRSLEQLSPAIIDGVLQQAAIDNPDFAHKFRMPSLRRFAVVAGGAAGGLCAVVAFLASMHFSAHTSLPVTTDALRVLPLPHSRRPAVGAIVRRANRHASRVMRVLRSTAARPNSRNYATAVRHVARSARSRILFSRAARLARLRRTPDIRRPRRARTPLSVARFDDTKVPRTQAMPDAGAYQDTYLVEATSQSQPPGEAPITAPSPPAGIPIKYCYSRGTWRTC